MCSNLLLDERTGVWAKKKTILSNSCPDGPRDHSKGVGDRSTKDINAGEDVE
jgi:hypothetical protein